MMMQDIAMHILDIGMNSIHAKATHIMIELANLRDKQELLFRIQDNGQGMNEEQLLKAQDPFYTTRTTRKVGLGIAFLKAASEMCDGRFRLTSKVQVGTVIEAVFNTSHWDCPPMGDIGEALVNLMVYDETIRFTIVYRNEHDSFVLDTNDIVQELDGIAMGEPSIMTWLKQFINEQITCIETKGG